MVYETWCRCRRSTWLLRGGSLLLLLLGEECGCRSRWRRTGTGGPRGRPRTNGARLWFLPFLWSRGFTLFPTTTTLVTIGKPTVRGRQFGVRNGLYADGYKLQQTQKGLDLTLPYLSAWPHLSRAAMGLICVVKSDEWEVKARERVCVEVHCTKREKEECFSLSTTEITQQEQRHKQPQLYIPLPKSCLCCCTWETETSGWGFHIFLRKVNGKKTWAIQNTWGSVPQRRTHSSTNYYGPLVICILSNFVKLLAYFAL